MNFGIIYLLKGEGHALKRICDLFNVSCSGFYKWFKGPISNRKKKDLELKLKIVEKFEESKGTYGVPRIKAALEKDGEKIGKNRVAKLMREGGLSGIRKKSFRPKTTINNPSARKSDRIFKIEETKIEKPNEVWASDLTYIPLTNGFAYLVVVMDLFNREILGWDLSDTMNAKKTKDALVNALRNVQGKPEGLVFHSDQGIQYCSSVFREKIDLLNINQSMSRKGNCYDNAFLESFFHTLKNEISKSRFKNIEEAKKEIFEYIECWYNIRRLHSSLGYMSPVEYKEQYRHAA